MTKYLKEEIDEYAIAKITNDLKKGKIVVFPTDTVYGIGTNAYNEDACKRIYEIKGRPKAKPLTVLVSDFSMLREMVDDVSLIEQKLIDTFWAGPLTIKFKKKYVVLPEIVSAGDEYVRIRLIDKGIVSKLIKESGVPIVAPSANISGSLTGTKIKNIIKELGEKVDYILDYGDIENDEVSTIVQVEGEEVIIIREGKIKKEELEKVVKVKC